MVWRRSIWDLIGEKDVAGDYWFARERTPVGMKATHWHRLPLRYLTIQSQRCWPI
jgi:hypothetical protein